jgi:hypothetical protein
MYCHFFSIAIPKGYIISNYCPLQISESTIHMSQLRPGDKVFHPNKREWGVGKVLGVRDERIDVFFVGAGSKQLSTTHVTLELAHASDANHPLLDNLTTASQEKGANFISLPEAIQKFLAAFPGGFEGSRFHSEEREYKVAAHELCLKKLAENEFARCLEASDYAGICDRARQVESATNLLASFEKIKFTAALKNPSHQKHFAMGLFNLLYGKDDEPIRFSRFAQTLGEMEIAKWPIATYFGFVRFPEHRIFIKPEVTQKAAALCCWEINYQPELNWRTYNGVLSLYQYMKEQLDRAGLNPRDMIDVQSFVWCTSNTNL